MIKIRKIILLRKKWYGDEHRWQFYDLDIDPTSMVPGNSDDDLALNSLNHFFDQFEPCDILIWKEEIKPGTWINSIIEDDVLLEEALTATKKILDAITDDPDKDQELVQKIQSNYQRLDRDLKLRKIL